MPVACIVGSIVAVEPLAAFAYPLAPVPLRRNKHSVRAFSAAVVLLRSFFRLPLPRSTKPLCLLPARRRYW